MQLNLRKARKLEAHIAGFTGVDSKSTRIKLLASTTDEQANDALTKAKEALATQNKNVLDLIKVQYGLRRKIEVANEAIGVHEKMNEREAIKAQISYLESLAEHDTNEPKEMLDLLAAKRASLAKGESSYASTSVSVQVSTLTELEVEALEQQVEQLKRKLEDVEEELLQKNVGGKITLEANEIEVLKSNGLV